MMEGFDSESPTRVDRLPPRVLVVDDDPTICNALVRILSHWGYLVGTASSVGEGLERAEAWRPRVLILDFNLGGEDGRDLLGLLREALGEHAPAVLCCTGMEGDVPPGAAALVAKPFHMRQLVQCVHDLARPPVRAPH